MGYSYKAISSEGEVKIGETNNLDKVDLARKLEKEGYFLFEVKEKRKQKEFLQLNWENLKSKITDKEIFLIGNEMYVLLNSGIHLKESLTILSEGNQSKNINEILYELLEGLDNGRLLSETLESKEYPNLLIAILKSGEKTGNMDLAFLQISEYYKKRYRLKEKLVSKLIYPLILLISTILVSIFTITKVLPEIIDLFTYNNRELPIVTRFILDGYNFILSHKSAILVFSFILFLLIIYLYKLKTYKIQRAIYRLPFLSKYLKAFYGLRFIQTQQLMLSSGLKLVKSIEISRMTISNPYLNKKLEDIQIEVEKGKSFSALLGKADIFPGILNSLIRVGEESGEMASILIDAIGYLEEDLEELMDRMLVIIEPLILIFITILIGGLLISIVTPMFEVTSFIS